MNTSLGTALVTGGSRGIGAEAAVLLAREGYDICFTFLNQADAAEEIVDRVGATGRKAWAIQADVADVEQAASVLNGIPSAAPPLVALVNNAGITGPIGPFLSTDLGTVRRVFEVNVLGAFALTQRVAAAWIANGKRGAIVNVSSIAATLGAPGEYVHYAASKAAVEAFTIGLGKELASTGIRVNCVSPGTSLTDIHAAAGEPDRPARVASRIPMGRAGEPKEIAEAIAWLVSPKASYVAGAILRVSGGL